MKFGANTFIWADHFDPEQTALLERLRQAGFDGIEIPLIEPKSMRTADVRRAIERSGLACTVCSVLPPGLSTLSDDTGIRKKTQEHLMRCIAATAELSASVIAGPLYAPVGYLPGHRRTQEERSEEHTSELQSRGHLVCRLLLEKKKKTTNKQYTLT